MFVLVIVPCTWFGYNIIIISLPLFFVSMLMLPEPSFVPRTSSFPPLLIFFSFSSPFSFFLLRWKWQGSPLIHLIWFSWEVSFLLLPICWLFLQEFFARWLVAGMFCNICCPLVGLLACFARIYCPLVGLLACFAGFSLLFHPCVGWSSAWVSPIHLSDIWTSLRSNNTIQSAGRVYSFGHLRSNNHLHLTLSPTDI